jgi:hypothetical protein
MYEKAPSPGQRKTILSQAHRGVPIQVRRKQVWSCDASKWLKKAIISVFPVVGGSMPRFVEVFCKHLLESRPVDKLDRVRLREGDRLAREG